MASPVNSQVTNNAGMASYMAYDIAPRTKQQLGKYFLGFLATSYSSMPMHALCGGGNRLS